MSKTLDFKEKYLGQLVDVEPGWGWPGECVSLVQRFIIEELGVEAKARGNGEAWRTVLINEGLGKRVERKDIRIGDIIAWDGNKGHVAICLGGDVIFEQVGPRGKAKVGSIAYWDKVQPSKGLVTRLNDFVDAEENDEKVEVDFNPYTHTIKAGSTLYKKDGSHHGLKTTRDHRVTIVEELNGLGRFTATWLVGVNDAWTKVGGAVKPAVSNVGKTAQLRGRVALYPNSTGGTKYIPSGKSRNLKILAEANGRFKVSSKDFNPNTVWVNVKDVKVV